MKISPGSSNYKGSAEYRCFYIPKHKIFFTVSADSTEKILYSFKIVDESLVLMPSKGAVIERGF